MKPGESSGTLGKLIGAEGSQVTGDVLQGDTGLFPLLLGHPVVTIVTRFPRS